MLVLKILMKKKGKEELNGRQENDSEEAKEEEKNDTIFIINENMDSIFIFRIK